MGSVLQKLLPCFNLFLLNLLPPYGLRQSVIALPEFLLLRQAQKKTPTVKQSESVQSTRAAGDSQGSRLGAAAHWHVP